MPDVRSRPDVILPAAFEGDPPRPGLARLAGGDRLVATTIQYEAGAGRAYRAGKRIVWKDWKVPLNPAYIVSDSKAVYLGSIATGDGELELATNLDLPLDERENDLLTDTICREADADPLDEKLKKRLLVYWRTSVIHGGRHWLIGFDPKPAYYEDGVLVVPTMHAIDLGAMP